MNTLAVTGAHKKEMEVLHAMAFSTASCKGLVVPRAGLALHESIRG